MKKVKVKPEKLKVGDTLLMGFRKIDSGKILVEDNKEQQIKLLTYLTHQIMSQEYVELGILHYLKTLVNILD